MLMPNDGWKNASFPDEDHKCAWMTSKVEENCSCTIAGCQRNSAELEKKGKLQTTTNLFPTNMLIPSIIDAMEARGGNKLTNVQIQAMSKQFDKNELSSTKAGTLKMLAKNIVFGYPTKDIEMLPAIKVLLESYGHKFEYVFWSSASELEDHLKKRIKDQHTRREVCRKKSEAKSNEGDCTYKFKKIPFHEVAELLYQKQLPDIDKSEKILYFKGYTLCISNADKTYQEVHKWIASDFCHATGIRKGGSMIIFVAFVRYFSHTIFFLSFFLIL